MPSAVLESVAAGVQVVLAAVLAVVAFRAYRRVRARRMAYLGLAFVALFAQGVLVAAGLFTTTVSLDDAVAGGLLLNAVALVIIYLGVLRP